MNSLGESSCNLLEPMPTDAGVCAVFNAVPFDHAFNTHVDADNMHRYSDSTPHFRIVKLLNVQYILG